MRRAFLRLVLIVAQRDYLRTVRRRGFIAGTLLLPAAMIGMFTLSTLLSTSGFSSEPGSPAPVVNESQVPLSIEPSLTPHLRSATLEEAEQQLAAGDISEYYVVPDSWPASSKIRLVVGEVGAGGIAGLARTEQLRPEVELMLRVSLMRANGVPDSALGQLLTPITIESVDPAGAPVSEASAVAGFALPYVFTLIFVLSIFITSGYLLQSVTEEKENRVAEIILSSVPPLPLMAGKVIGLGAAGLTQVLIWLLTALAVIPLVNQQLSLQIGISPVTLVLAVVFFVLGYLAYGAIFAALGALAPGAREAQQYSSFFGFFAVIPLIATPAFASDPGSPIVIALSLFPLTAPAATLELLAISDTPWLLVVASLVVQVLFVGLAIIAASRIFRATLLLYGVRPSLGRIISAITARP